MDVSIRCSIETKPKVGNMIEVKDIDLTKIDIKTLQKTTPEPAVSVEAIASAPVETGSTGDISTADNIVVAEQTTASGPPGIEIVPPPGVEGPAGVEVVTVPTEVAPEPQAPVTPEPVAPKPEPELTSVAMNTEPVIITAGPNGEGFVWVQGPRGETGPVGEPGPPGVPLEKGSSFLKWMQVLFWGALVAFMISFAAQTFFNLPHPKFWYNNLLFEKRASETSLTIPVVVSQHKVIDVDRFLITIENPDGTVEKRAGGSLSWRLNNPGRLVYSNWTVKHGAIGTDGDYAVFKTYEDGRRANEILLFEDAKRGYSNLSIREAVIKYTEGQTHYATMLAKKVGVPVGTLLSALNDKQRKKFLDGIEEVEGFDDGRVWKYKDKDEYKRLG